MKERGRRAEVRKKSEVGGQRSEVRKKLEVGGRKSEDSPATTRGTGRQLAASRRQKELVSGMRDRRERAKARPAGLLFGTLVKIV